MSNTYNQQQIDQMLSETPGWSFEDGVITRTFKFSTFPDGIDFVQKVADAAEKANHHPDIDIRYTQIKLALVSHDVGGITDRDFNLASEINSFA